MLLPDLSVAETRRGGTSPAFQLLDLEQNPSASARKHFFNGLLAAVTPASGFVGPPGGFAIGLIAGGACYWAATSLKRRLGYDDSLDVFGVHGVGGLIGTLLVAVFASTKFGGKVANLSIGSALGTQALAAGVTIVYTLVMSFVLLKLVDVVVGLRVDEDEEIQGLDVSDHGETGYNY